MRNPGTSSTSVQLWAAPFPRKGIRQAPPRTTECEEWEGVCNLPASDPAPRPEAPLWALHSFPRNLHSPAEPHKGPGVLRNSALSQGRKQGHVPPAPPPPPRTGFRAAGRGQRCPRIQQRGAERPARGNGGRAARAHRLAGVPGPAVLGGCGSRGCAEGDERAECWTNYLGHVAQPPASAHPRDSARRDVSADAPPCLRPALSAVLTPRSKTTRGPQKGKQESRPALAL